jgi:hypothetical protein
MVELSVEERQGLVTLLAVPALASPSHRAGKKCWPFLASAFSPRTSTSAAPVPLGNTIRPVSCGDVVRSGGVVVFVD